MDKTTSPEGMPFFQRLALAWKVLVSSVFAGELRAGLAALGAQRAAPRELPPERVHASGLFLLSALQREGRLVDFLQQEVAGFSDEEVGAAARVVHGGCRKALRQYFDFEPARSEPEGTSLTVPAGFDAQRTRLTGNVAGQPPFRGTLKHHGWVATQIRLAVVSDSVDPRVVAPAEVEIS